MTFLEQLNLKRPVVQAGMGGGVADGKLAGTVSQAGGLGTVGMVAANRMEAELRRAKEIAPGRPVAANLLIPFARRAHVDACRKAGAHVVALHGGFSSQLIRQLKGSTVVLQTVGTAAEARRALTAGADGLIVQGIEAGGHLVGVEPAPRALRHVQAVSGEAPLLLAGGIASAEDTSVALEAGAEAVVAGTRFLLTDECPAHHGYKQAVLEAPRTLETQLFGFGWPMRHRVVPNAATNRWCRGGELGPAPIRAIQSITRPLTRLPLLGAAQRMPLTQHPLLPLFGPGPPLEGMPPRTVQASALYAGVSALRITSLVSAAEAVKLLAGAA